MINHSPIIFTDLRPAPAKARARKSDPSVSHDAAKRVEMGKAERQRAYIKSVLMVRGPKTMIEASYQSPWAAHELLKRVNEVKGIAPTGKSRNGSRVWGIV